MRATRRSANRCATDRRSAPHAARAWNDRRGATRPVRRRSAAASDMVGAMPRLASRSTSSLAGARKAARDSSRIFIVADQRHRFRIAVGDDPGERASRFRLAEALCRTCRLARDDARPDRRRGSAGRSRSASAAGAWPARRVARIGCRTAGRSSSEPCRSRRAAAVRRQARPRSDNGPRLGSRRMSKHHIAPFDAEVLDFALVARQPCQRLRSAWMALLPIRSASGWPRSVAGRKSPSMADIGADRFDLPVGPDQQQQGAGLDRGHLRLRAYVGRIIP